MCVSVWLCVTVATRASACACLYVSVCVCSCLLVSVCVFVSIRVCVIVYRCVCLSESVCVCMCICMCICVHMHVYGHQWGGPQREGLTCPWISASSQVWSRHPLQFSLVVGGVHPNDHHHAALLVAERGGRQRAHCEGRIMGGFSQAQHHARS